MSRAERLSRYSELALTALRVVTGLIMMAHGVQKLSGPSETAQGFASVGIPVPQLAVVLAIFGEFGGGLGLALGALTRIAALGPLLVMVAALAWVHIGNGLFMENGGVEYPLILLLVSLVFVVRGAGPYSLDAWLKRTREAGRGAREPARPGAPPGELHPTP